MSEETMPPGIDQIMLPIPDAFPQVRRDESGAVTGWQTSNFLAPGWEMVTHEEMEAAKEEMAAAVDEARLPKPTIENLRAETSRRIAATGLPWMVEREISGGKAIPEDVKKLCSDIRAAGAKMEKKVPADFLDDKHWPKP